VTSSTTRPGGVSVLVVASKPPPIAGQALATERLLEALDAAAIPHADVDLSAELTKHGALAVALRAARVARLPFEVLRQGRRLHGGPSVFYLQLGLSPSGILRDLPLLALARRQRWPTVVHVHGEIYFRSLERAPRWLRAASRTALARVNRVVVLSERLAEPFRQVVPSERITVVANGVSGELAADAATLPPRCSPGRSLRLLFLSNLIPAKGYLTVLEAARLSQDRGLGHRFQLAGAIATAAKVHPARFAEAHGLGNVDFLGPVGGQAKLRLLREADALLLPSETEAQPLVILEALHYGLPVIATAVGGIPDLVVEGRTGILVPLGDQAALIAGVERLALNPGYYEALSAGARAAGAGYTAEKHGAAMVRLLGQVSAEGAR